jgi:hypothetical protein
VAVTVGSRGIAGLDVLVRATVETFARWASPPSSSRRWGATAAGRPRASGPSSPSSASPKTRSAARSAPRWTPTVLGTDSFGLPIHFDANALKADGIVLLNRIKPHTSFTGRYESGLLKMLTIGLGKRQGAAQVHKLGLPGLKRMLPEVGTFLLGHTPVALGLAILENAHERTARVVPVEPRSCSTSSPAS